LIGQVGKIETNRINQNKKVDIEWNWVYVGSCEKLQEVIERYHYLSMTFHFEARWVK
jgi:hypothetical protein